MSGVAVRFFGLRGGVVIAFNGVFGFAHVVIVVVVIVRIVVMIVIVIMVVGFGGGRARLVALSAVALGEAFGVFVTAGARQIGLEVVGPNQIFDVQERGALHADVDERGLHAGQHAGHATEHDVADGSACGSALDLELGDDPFFD